MTIDPFSPTTIGPISLRNHFIRSGANEMMSINGKPTKALVEFHRAYAKGGVGMTTLAYIAVSSDGRTMIDQGMMVRDSVPHYRAVTDAVHAHGAKVSAQITHGGSFTQMPNLSTPRAMSASGGLDKMGFLSGRFFQRAMTRNDMDMVRDEFVQAALLAQEAGFDAIELHMGHGYLLNQFLSPLSNFRKDEYGGSAENRARYPAEIAAAVKKAVGDKLAILAKINLSDGVAKGATVEDAIVTARALEQAGVDMLVLSAGRNIESTSFMFGSALPYDELAAMQSGILSKIQFAILKRNARNPPIFKPNYLFEYATALKAGLSSSRTIKLAYLGGVQSLSGAQEALDEGFDAIVIARALIHDPDMLQKWQKGRRTVSGCTACNRCVSNMYGPSGTHCPEVSNALDPKLKTFFANGETIYAA